MDYLKDQRNWSPYRLSTKSPIEDCLRYSVPDPEFDDNHGISIHLNLNWERHLTNLISNIEVWKFAKQLQKDGNEINLNIEKHVIYGYIYGIHNIEYIIIPKEF